jgi:hypothetical protein
MREILKPIQGADAENVKKCQKIGSDPEVNLGFSKACQGQRGAIRAPIGALPAHIGRNPEQFGRRKGSHPCPRPLPSGLGYPALAQASRA